MPLPHPLIPRLATLCAAGLVFWSLATSAAGTNTGPETLPPGIAPLPASPPATTPRLNPAEIAFARLAVLDLPALKKTLEQAGWPRESVVAILQSETERRFNPPFVPHASDLHPFEFWRTGPDGEALPEFKSSGYSAELGRRERQVIETITVLFPPGNEPPTAMAAWEADRRWGTVPAASRGEIERIITELEPAVRAALDRTDGPDWRLAWRLQTDARRKIERLLTKDELLDYDLRNSATAQNLRNELDNFLPSREEFLAIFRLRHPIELQFPDQPEEADAALAAEKRKVVADVETKIAAALGKTRYEEYNLSRDPDCNRLQFYARLTGRADRPTVRKLVRDVKTFRAQLAAIPHPGTAAATAEADKLRNALREKVQAALGDQVTGQFFIEAGLMP